MNTAAQSAQCAVPPSPWLTSAEAARYLKVQERTILAWARSGKVLGYTLSGTQRHVWRFRIVDLDATMESPAVPTKARIN
jgi:excisionase family DNA binding protein